MESCNGLAPGVTDLPIEQIKKTVRPTGDQLAALDELNSRRVKAKDAVKASCPTAVPLTPVARLDAAEARLDTMIQAVQIVRDPLQRFYVLLNDEQRHASRPWAAVAAADRRRPAAISPRCAVEQSGDVAKLPVQRIEQVVQPSGQQQQDAFNALKQASHDAAEQLQASCPKRSAADAGGAARCGQDPAHRHGRGDEHHPAEAARLLRFAERRAEGEVQHHGAGAERCVGRAAGQND